MLDVTAVGEYSLGIDNVEGRCADFSCCPFIVKEVAPVSSFSLAGTSPTCSGAVSLTNSQIQLTGLTSTTASPLTYQLTKGGNSFETAARLTPDRLPLPESGVLSTTLSAGTYWVRVYNKSGCY